MNSLSWDKTEYACFRLAKEFGSSREYCLRRENHRRVVLAKSAVLVERRVDIQRVRVIDDEVEVVSLEVVTDVQLVRKQLSREVEVALQRDFRNAEERTLYWRVVCIYKRNVAVGIDKHVSTVGVLRQDGISVGRTVHNSDGRVVSDL